MTKIVSAPGVQSRGGDKHIKHIIAMYSLGSLMVQICRVLGSIGERWSQGNAACRRKSLLATRIIRSWRSVGEIAFQVEGPAWAGTSG